jgi:hypothetical protein
MRLAFPEILYNLINSVTYCNTRKILGLLNDLPSIGIIIIIKTKEPN